MERKSSAESLDFNPWASADESPSDVGLKSQTTENNNNSSSHALEQTPPAETPPHLTPALSESSLPGNGTTISLTKALASSERLATESSVESDFSRTATDTPDNNKSRTASRRGKKRPSAAKKRVTLTLPGLNGAANRGSSSTSDIQQNGTSRHLSRKGKYLASNESTILKPTIQVEDLFVNIQLKEIDEVGEFRHPEPDKSSFWKWRKPVTDYRDSRVTEFAAMDCEVETKDKLEAVKPRPQWANWTKRNSQEKLPSSEPSDASPVIVVTQEKWPEFNEWHKLEADLDSLVQESSRKISAASLSEKPGKRRLSFMGKSDIRSLTELSRGDLEQMSTSELMQEKQRLLDRIQLLSTMLVDHLETREIVRMQNADCQTRIAELLQMLAKNKKKFLKNSKKFALNQVSLVKK